MSELLRLWLHDEVGLNHPVGSFEQVRVPSRPIFPRSKAKGWEIQLPRPLRPAHRAAAGRVPARPSAPRSRGDVQHEEAPPRGVVFPIGTAGQGLKCQAGFSFFRRCAAPAGVVGPAFLERVKDARAMRRFRVNRVCAHRGARSPSSMTASGRELIRTASRSSSSS